MPDFHINQRSGLEAQSGKALGQQFGQVASGQPTALTPAGGYTAVSDARTDAENFLGAAYTGDEVPQNPVQDFVDRLEENGIPSEDILYAVETYNGPHDGMGLDVASVEIGLSGNADMQEVRDALKSQLKTGSPDTLYDNIQSQRIQPDNEGELVAQGRHDLTQDVTL
mgnify:CR=1 FL=1